VVGERRWEKRLPPWWFSTGKPRRAGTGISSLSVWRCEFAPWANCIQEKDTNGYYPLHYACRFKQSNKAVLKLMNDFPKAGELKDDVDDNYPLH
jgi:hypothetical protein